MKKSDDKLQVDDFLATKLRTFARLSERDLACLAELQAEPIR